MILAQNVDASEIFDEKRFVSRSSSTVKFTVQSMHTDAGQHFSPGFKSVPPPPPPPPRSTMKRVTEVIITLQDSVACGKSFCISSFLVQWYSSQFLLQFLVQFRSHACEE